MPYYYVFKRQPRFKSWWVNQRTKRLLRQIGAKFSPAFYTYGMPQIHLTDLTSDSRFDVATFGERLILGEAAGFNSSGESPFPSGPVRLTLVRWGPGRNQCGRIEVHSELNATSIVSYTGVTIGRDVLLGPGVVIMDCDGHPVDRRKPDEAPEGLAMAPVTIKDRAWIGAGAMILKGVSIGEHAVIGASAVVTQSVPPYRIALGNPARLLSPGREGTSIVGAGSVASE